MSDHPLPFFNGEYWLDNSTLASWKECARLYQYSSLLRKRNAFSRAALNYGKAIHLALSALEVQCGAEYTGANLDALSALLASYFEANPQPPDDHRQLGLAVETVKRYTRLYEIEPWKIAMVGDTPFIERVIYHPIASYNGIPINYWGVIDLGVNKSDGFWIVDTKTAYQMADTFAREMAVSGQTRGYSWLVQRCLTGIKPVGYIINGIRNTAPTQTAQKDQKSLDKWWQDQFRRFPFYLSDETVEEWEMTTRTHITRLLRDHEAGHWPMNDKSCVGKYGPCQFYDICTLPRIQRVVALNSNNYMEDNWTIDMLKGKV